MGASGFLRLKVAFQMSLSISTSRRAHSASTSTDDRRSRKVRRVSDLYGGVQARECHFAGRCSGARCSTSRPELPLPSTTPPRMQRIRMDIVPARDLGDRGLRRQRLLDQAQLLSPRPPSSSLRARKDRGCASSQHVCDQEAPELKEPREWSGTGALSPNTRTRTRTNLAHHG